MELLPGTGQDDIVCSLTEHSLSSSPQYEALSYCWGDENDTTPIEVNGSKLDITRSLRSALLHLRNPNHSRFIWADAVCINEQDMTERAYQVSIMGDIYRSAIRTLIWLGPADDESGRAFSMCARLAAYAESSESKGKEAVKTKDDFDSNDSSLEHLVERPWWTRVWVVQEVILAREAIIVCGLDAMRWETLHSAVEKGLEMEIWEKLILGLIEGREFENLQTFKMMKQVDEYGAMADRFFHLLLQLRKRDATNPRDKIFSCLGLLDDKENELAFRADYDSPVEHVYINAATTILTHSGNLDLLGVCSANQRKESVLELPSWVPDWSITNSIALPLNKDPTGPRRKFSTTGDSRANPRFTGDGHTLVLAGHVIDEISTISDALPDLGEMNWSPPSDEESSTPPEETSAMEDLRGAARDLAHISSNLLSLVPYLSTFLEWEKFAMPKDLPSREKGMQAEEVYWRTLCVDQMPEGYEETLRQYHEWHKSLQPLRNMLRWRTNYATGIFKMAGFVAYLRSTWEKYPKFGVLFTHLAHRRLGRTKKGYLCLVPESAMVGDKIALCSGGQVPLVLREKGEEGYNLVGESFVLELMQGNTLNESDCLDINIV